jgi:hypothetical protein
MGRSSRYSSRHYHPAKKKPKEDGFSLLLAIIVGLILLLGGIGLANRVGLSVLGAVFQGQGLSARAAAEAGAERIIGELNMPPNRRFLLSSSSQASNTLWSSSELATGSSLASVCIVGSQTLSSNRQLGTTGSPSSTGPYPWVYLDNTGKVATNPNNATQAYRLVAIARQPFSQFSLSSDTGWGVFKLVVDGASVRNGALSTQIRLDKDYQVMPKCCRLSFGHTDTSQPTNGHGRIPYTFDGSGSATDCLNSALGFGLVGGAAENNTGTVVLRGNTEAFTSTNQPVPIIYCVVSDEVAGTCTPTDNAQNLSVRNVTANMPNIPLPPAPIASNNSSGATLTSAAVANAPTLQGGNSNTLCGTGSPTTFCRTIGSGASQTLVIDGGVSQSEINTHLSSFCTVVNTGALSTNGRVATKEELHCAINRLVFTNSAVPRVRIATNGRAIRFYFISPDPNNSSPVIEGQGNSTLSVCTTTSGSCLSPADLSDVSLLGCPSPVQTYRLYNSNGSQRTCSPQTARLGGTPAAGSGGGLFLWFPNGNLDLVGTSAFTGVAWGNTVSANGTVDFVVPGAGLGNVLFFSGFVNPPTGGGGVSTFPIVDFVARATSNFKWCSASASASGCS